MKRFVATTLENKNRKTKQKEIDNLSFGGQLEISSTRSKVGRQKKGY